MVVKLTNEVGHFVLLMGKKLGQFFLIHHVDNRMIASGFKALPEHDLGPAVLTKDIALSLENTPCLFE
jgi:hypothetical protein